MAVEDATPPTQTFVHFSKQNLITIKIKLYLNFRPREQGARSSLDEGEPLKGVAKQRRDPILAPANYGG